MAQVKKHILGSCKMDIKSFWNAVISQNKDSLRLYFHDDAVIRWHCSNEEFTVSEYIRANCEYPGNWHGEIERIENIGDSIILAAQVFPAGERSSFHVVSFVHLDENDKIVQLDEYWADDGEAPAWRKQMKIGKPIRTCGE